MARVPYGLDLSWGSPPLSGGGSLSDVGVIMMIMHVLMVKSLCQAVMGRVPVLKCLMSGVRGRLWLCPIMLGVIGRRFLRTRLQWLYLALKRPPGVAARGLGACRARL
jgi:hypothetical protein